MKNRTNQIYEEYLSYTAAWTNIHGKKFIECLKLCVNFIDRHKVTTYNNELYNELQNEVVDFFGFKGSDAGLSARKGINQLVKIGFLKPYLSGYRNESIDFLNAKTNLRRENIISKVVYNYSNFQNSITEPEQGTTNQIKFIIKTLEEVGSLDKRALVALMTANIEKYPRGYLLKSELDVLYNTAWDEGFIDRKYNQLGHLLNLLGRLNDLCNHDGVIYFKTDADRLFGDEETRKSIRDPYLQRIYKSELEEESCMQFKCKVPKCMLEKLDYPVLIASHIKPYKDSDETQQFDVNNGLLLSKNIDSLFDLGYITFNNDGTIVTSRYLSDDLKRYVSNFSLDNMFINDKRMEYMEYHRNNVFEKRFAAR